MEKQGNVPQLRFPGFEGEWVERTLGEICIRIMDGTHFSPKSPEGPYMYITSKNIRMGYLDLESVSYISKEEHDQIYKRCPVVQFDILLTKDGANTGNACVNSLDFPFSLLSSVAVIRPRANFHYGFLFQVISSENGQKAMKDAMAGQAITRITLEKIKRFIFSFPTLPEQTKIADFLSAVDEKLQALQRKKALLTDYKKGMMQQIFSQTLRFKDDTGHDFPDWEEKRLGFYLEVSKAKNLKLKYTKDDVLSVSGEYGIVNQIEFQGRSFAGESVHNYGIVEHGDIVYTKSPLKSNPFGIIKFNKGKSGIVSTLYAIYKCKKTANGLFIDYYFQLHENTNSYLRPLVQKGSKNDMKISNEKVLIDPVIFPSLPEQTKIAAFLSALDEKIEVTQQAIDQTSAWKKGLLQQLFV